MMAAVGMGRLQKVILAHDKWRKAQIWDVKSDSIADQSSKQLTRYGAGCVFSDSDLLGLESTCQKARAQPQAYLSPARFQRGHPLTTSDVRSVRRFEKKIVCVRHVHKCTCMCIG